MTAQNRLRFAAIDFETANHSRDSACAIGLVVVDGGRIVDRYYELIQPPSREFLFTKIHGLTWNDVSVAPTFAGIWQELKKRVDSVAFMAAHNAPFDNSVLNSCCRTYGIPDLRTPFICTVRMAREVWNIYPTSLPEVCQRLGIPLRHHKADSDAEACARIIIEATKAGWSPSGP